MKTTNKSLITLYALTTALNGCSSCSDDPANIGMYADANPNVDDSGVHDSGLDALVQQLDSGASDNGSLDFGINNDTGFIMNDGGFSDSGNPIDGGNIVIGTPYANAGPDLLNVPYGRQFGYNFACTSTRAREAWTSLTPLPGHDGPMGTGSVVPTGYQLQVRLDNELISTEPCGPIAFNTFNNYTLMNVRVVQLPSGRIASTDTATVTVDPFTR